MTQDKGKDSSEEKIIKELLFYLVDSKFIAYHQTNNNDDNNK